MSSSFVIQFDLKEKEKLLRGLEEQGFVLSQPPYTLFQGKKKGISCTLYASGKLMVQGKEKDSFIKYYLEPEILGSFTYGYEEMTHDITARIGVDESGKGDFFGPLCIAGLFADTEGVHKLHKMGVKDSKKLKDSTIAKLAGSIRKQFSYHIVTIGPKRYNELYEKFGNLNTLLGWGHATVIEEMVKKSGCHNVIIDKFAAEHVVRTALHRKKLEIMLTQKVHAEEDLVVAGASILARDAFVAEMERLSKRAGIDLPKGASKATLVAGKRLVAAFGADILKEVAKTHFNTYGLIFSNEK